MCWHFSIYRFVTLSLLVKDQPPLWWYLKNLISLNVWDTESFSSGSCKSLTFSSPKFSVKFSQKDFFKKNSVKMKTIVPFLSHEVKCKQALPFQITTICFPLGWEIARFVLYWQDTSSTCDITNAFVLKHYINCFAP